MRMTLLFLSAVLLLSGCKEKDKNSTAGTKENKPGDPAYLLTKDGIGDIKIGMTRTDLEKMLKQSIQMKHAGDTGEIWVDTATIKYKDIEVECYFQKQYSENPTTEMELFGLSTKSPLCKTASGLGVGSERAEVLAAFEDNPINMGPESVMVNDTTWELSKTNYYINISDDKWDKQISFQLVNKKVARVEATLSMGE